MTAPGCFDTIAALSRQLRDGSLSPVLLTTQCLQRIERVDPLLHAYINVTAESALHDAHVAESEIGSGRYRGVLHGIPYTLKDLFLTQGIRTTAGSRILEDYVPDEDATVVARLREAGAILVGKTNLHEFAFGPLSTNPHYGDVRNPWDTDRHSGGSSGGAAAAVAAGTCAFAIGSDTTGSIRIPAAFCGIIGLKPTYGRVSRHGAIPLAWSLDHVGPLCRTAEDAAAVMQVIAGWDPHDPSSSQESVPDFAGTLDAEVQGIRIGVLAELGGPVTPEVATAFSRALDCFVGMGAKIEKVTIPELGYCAAVASAVLYPEALSYHEHDFERRPNAYAADVRERLALGKLVSGADYVKGQRVRRLLMERVNSALASVDVLICPTEPVPAPRLDDDTIEIDGVSEIKSAVVTRFTRPFNLTGHPAVTVPCGFASTGLPVAFQLVGPHFAEPLLLRVAHAYQQRTSWHTRLPDLPIDA